MRPRGAGRLGPAAVLVACLAFVGCGGKSSSSHSTTTTAPAATSVPGLSDPDVEAKAFDPCILTAEQMSAVVGFAVADGVRSKGSIDEMRADECSYASSLRDVGAVSVQSLYGVTLKQVVSINIESAVLLKGTVDQAPIEGLPASFLTDVSDVQTVFSIGPMPLAASVSLGTDHAQKLSERAASIAVAKALAAAV